MSEKIYTAADSLLVQQQETIRQQQATIEAYENTVKLKDIEIERLKLDILDAWTDENGTTWFRPTSWAYAQVCRVKNEQQAEIERLTEQRDRLLAMLKDEEEHVYDSVCPYCGGKDYHTVKHSSGCHHSRRFALIAEIEAGK
jgi:hypothetical protein